MHGECFSCSRPTSTLHTTRCKNCYKKEVQQKYLDKNSDRDKEIISLIKGGKTAAEVARLKNLSRESIRLILLKNKVKYQAIKAKRKLDKKTRWCVQCGKKFIINQDGASVKYCSKECNEIRHKLLQREKIREYYQTAKGKAAQKRYVAANKEKIRSYFKTWMEKRRVGEGSSAS